jgi:hypothetical protein
MKIGNIPKEGESPKINKWIVGVEICKHTPYRFYQGFALKPYILIVCVKTTDFGTEHLEINGTPARRVGGWWRFESPIGVNINII